MEINKMRDLLKKYCAASGGLFAVMVGVFSMLFFGCCVVEPKSAAFSTDKSDAENAHVVIIGDSTVATYEESSPKRGWGQMIPRFFDDRVTVDNRALSGRSTKTFIGQGWWAKTLDALHPSDYVLIQFGHNDSHNPSRPEATDAFGDYQTYLRQYIDEARAKGAVPILVTPMHRRSFDESGKLLSCRINDDGEKDGDLDPYARAMKQVAASNNVTCIDLFTLSGEYMQHIGDEACIELLAPGDRTHWNGKGATRMALLVIKGLANSDEPLKKHIRNDVKLDD